MSTPTESVPTLARHAPEVEPGHVVPFATASPLPTRARAAVVRELNALLADVLALHAHLKVAHWNLRGALFASLHPALDGYADRVAAHTDAIAERAVMLGGRAWGTPSQVAARMRVPEYPADLVADGAHVAELCARVVVVVQGVHAARLVAEGERDLDTADLLTEVGSDLERTFWLLSASRPM